MEFLHFLNWSIVRRMSSTVSTVSGHSLAVR
ncbi:GSCOCG00002543001-RA-CDS [Cotesia congregata]|nr:GSCOCG00002543001-RA-CDS [Cotesia congregata]